MRSESTSPIGGMYSYAPRNFRDIIQRQIQHTVNRSVDAVIGLSVGNFDGRFIGSFPGKVQQLQDTSGRFYHLVGVNIGGDGSVAGP